MLLGVCCCCCCSLSPEARDLIRSCLDREPLNRPTAQELLLHPLVIKHSLPGQYQQQLPPGQARMHPAWHPQPQHRQLKQLKQQQSRHGLQGATARASKSAHSSPTGSELARMLQQLASRSSRVYSQILLQHQKQLPGQLYERMHSSGPVLSAAAQSTESSSAEGHDKSSMPASPAYVK